ncbi:hypothetical protein roselon_00133 [Roseibacterium elongatum DSM 19469]|uniref:DUF302 domain-containing protein n=1 Tax=Roseicyclus elongatus DSM 19469 TaxID=1294273 RepID=W8SJB3_9RHOB|nr:hypothetical protein [Roseibacterium elongatum]AHM02590.1 hypothetical protein roselon_00133 [Roseibacterium elongatum DSM 19469]
MKQTLLQQKYPVFHLEIAKEETSCATVDDIIARLQARIDAEPNVAEIAVFDHYAHTSSFGGDIHPEILAAKNLVFCFGYKLPDPVMLSVRPRSIGVADLGTRFVISFLEAPMEIATTAMEGWCKEIADKVVAA